MCELPTAFVTVGTTSFDNLIQHFLDNANLIQFLTSTLACRHLILQIGRSQFDPDFVRSKIISSIPSNSHHLNVTCYRYKADLVTDFASADLIISHAGAGSCVDALTVGGKSSSFATASRPPLLVVVVNDQLMHNHQWELADALTRQKFAYCCTPDGLLSVLQKEFVNNSNSQSANAIVSWLNGEQEQAMLRFKSHIAMLMGFH